jgi:hypothetical protein
MRVENAHMNSKLSLLGDVLGEGVKGLLALYNGCRFCQVHSAAALQQSCEISAPGIKRAVSAASAGGR